MGGLTQTVLLLHVLAAFVYGAGYVGTNLLTEQARRTEDSQVRRYALRFSGVLDRLNMIGGTFAGVTGILAVFVFGYSLVTPWVLAAIAIYALIVGTGIAFWGRIGREIERAIGAGDEASAIALLRSPRNIAVSRAENILFVTLVSLMVLRPGL